jgi:MIF4G domain
MDTFEKLSTKIIESNITSEDILVGLIAMISDKAVDEPHFASIYAMLCQKLFTQLPSVHAWVCPSNEVQDNIFRKLLLKRCQEEFEKGSKWKAADDEAQIARKELRKRIDELSAEEKNQIAEEDYQRGKLKRRVLGNMVFIGELYRNTLISESVIHRCLKSLLSEIENPEEEDIESLCKLLVSAGKNLDHHRAEALMNQYFERIDAIITGANLSSRIKFLLMDVVDLRKNKWIPKSGVVAKPKTIAEVHKEIQQEEKSKALAQRQGGKNTKRLTKQSQQSQHQDVRKIAQKNDGEWRQAWGSSGAKSRPATTPTTEPPPTAKLSNAYGALDAEQTPEKPASVPSKPQSQIMEEAFKEYRDSLEASEFLEDIQDVDEDEVVLSLVKQIAQFLVDKNGRPALKVIFLLKKLFYADEDSESTMPSYSPDLLVSGFRQFFETFDDDRSDFPKGFFNPLNSC